VTPKKEPTRQPLTRERVLRAAVDLADREGLGALTMRRLGASLGVEAMSLYKHVANKEAILDGIVEVVVAEIELPREGEDWKEAMRRRAFSARAVLTRHAWAIGLLEARGSTVEASMRYLDAVLGTLRAAGFSLEDAAHGFWLLDSFVYGHVVQEISVPPGDLDPDASAGVMGEYRHLAELRDLASRSTFSVDGEFAFGLELILDGLTRKAMGDDPTSPSATQRHRRTGARGGSR
jgi:AcrR family transcriptional regulator